MNRCTVETPRLRIVPNDFSGMEALYAACTDEEMRQAYREMMEEMRRTPGQEEWGCEWSIFLRETGASIGGVCFKGVPDESGCVELGYGIDEAARCRGYATETVRAMADWAFADPRVRRVVAQTEPGNRISQRVLTKCSFVRDGCGAEGPQYALTATPRLLRLREHPEYAGPAASWFHSKWGVPTQAYAESVADCLQKRTAVPQWYLAMEQGRIVGGLGVIENDFHDRPDLAPNVCAVYVEPEHRNQGLAGQLLALVCADMHVLGVDTLYLLTNHTGFYERYGWEFFCMAQGDGEEQPSRLYRHRYSTQEHL